MILDALQKVFRKPIYVVLALVVSASAFVLAVWLPNIRLVAGIVSSPDVPFSSKLELPLSLLGSITTNFTLLSASYTIAIAILFGIYIAMTIYFLKRRIKEVGQSGIATGFLGIGSSVLGVGCAACGSFLLTSILSLVGAPGALAILPLGGSEFGIIGVILLVISIYITSKQIENPAVCKI
jgi:hypothetical protein